MVCPIMVSVRENYEDAMLGKPEEQVNADGFAFCRHHPDSECPTLARFSQGWEATLSALNRQEY